MHKDCNGVKVDIGDTVSSVTNAFFGNGVVIELEEREWVRVNHNGYVHVVKANALIVKSL